MFFVIQINTNFYNEFYIHLLCEFFVVLDYDETNCNIVSRIFLLMYSKVQIMVICNNHEVNVKMNGSVKFVET
jgi:hypothetical protein